MTDEYKQTAAEIYTRQHEFYAAQTAVTLQFPIKLMLTLNAAAVAASLLLVRESLGSADATAVVESVRSAFWAFGAGVICVLAASWFQWQLYSKIMHRKRNLLSQAIKADSWAGAMEPFVNEPNSESKTSFQNYCFVFVAFSFGLFLFGTYLIASGL